MIAMQIKLCNVSDFRLLAIVDGFFGCTKSARRSSRSNLNKNELIRFLGNDIDLARTTAPIALDNLVFMLKKKIARQFFALSSPTVSDHPYVGCSSIHASMVSFADLNDK